ncbi:uncharacterized protein LOC132725818 [Ruditapes philippinarum]|uniref:uncharacterized protein LOC132725818 n=1 Tax=Ruditapes philippinarum TaxID=129788 RepID=UPI00295A921A|nr:uncharacterized protein LOC132725818 [Ruditapes philippinarum]
MDAELRTDKEHQNFVSIYRGFAYVGEKLESYTKEGLDRTYQNIYKTLAGYPPCRQNCSRKYKCQYGKWCRTCNGWRNHLLKTRKSRNVPWELTHSWEWPRSYSNIIEVYLPASWQTDDKDIKDVSTACFIWENCLNQYIIKPFIIKNIRKFRNQYFAHNTSLKATDSEKGKVFDVLKDLLKEQHVQSHIDVQECLNHLFDIEQGYQIEKWMVAVQDLIEQHGFKLNKLEDIATDIKQQHHILGDIQNGQDFLIEGQENLRREVENIQTDLTLFRRDFNKLFKDNDSIFLKLFSWANRCIPKTQIILVISVFLLIVFFSTLWMFVFKHFVYETEKDKYHDDRACMSEQYSVPFPQDLPLLGYLNEHKTLVGRQWLMESLQYDLFNSNSKNHGIVLVAEMGYGKSAFVSKLLCPGPMKFANDINKHIVAFHVCKFDVQSTHLLERLIRRLVGFFAKKSAEYGNIVSMFPESHILFNRDSCNKEPEACFDQGVTIPLKQLTSVSDSPWVIVVDAIDECGRSGNNPVLNLLSDRIRQLPKWLKFLITSRHVSQLTMLKKMKLDYLYSNDPRNIEDIKTFIEKSFPKHTHRDMINNLVYKSEGNFVYIIQALKWVIDNKDNETVPDFPTDLGDVYDINFGRQFGGTSFRIPKLIFEIICSTLNPVSKSEIFAILKSSNISLTKDEFDLYFKSLSFFLREGEDVGISHQALYFWLIDKRNENYQISLKNGHTLISKYLFSKIADNYTKNIVDLAIHVANSADISLRKMFLSSTFLISNEVQKEPILHKLIWKTPCVEALELLTNHFPDVNAFNEGNVTPSFVAAAKGHTDQINLLHNKGANLNFIVKGQMLINSYEVFNKLEMIKLYYYSGYSLLHIASQHGHHSTVKYILAFNHSLVYVRNTLGLNAGHVACENGHLNVVKEMTSLHTKTFFYECMYYASKRNHKHIAAWLVSNGFTFDCISDQMSIEAFQNVTKFDHFHLIEHGFATFPNDSLNLHLIVPLDVWWIIFKHNPLITAIKTGSMDVAIYLLNTFYKARKCYDAFGYTAALTSVRFNRTELYPLLNKEIASDKCGKIPNHLKLKTEEPMHALIDTFLSDKCPENGSVSHVVALYAPDDQIYSHVIRNRLDVNWNHSDSFGNYPIHYAVANRNFLFIYLFEKVTLLSKSKHFSLLDILTLNGSTAFHTSAISDQYLIMFLLTDSFEKPVPDIKDYNGRGIMHYLVLKEFDGVVSSPEMESHKQSLHTLRYLLEISNHSLSTRDSFGRNILHYSMKNGHYHVVLYLLQYQKTIFYSMLTDIDNERTNPFDFALKKYERKNFVIVLPKHAMFSDIYLSSANIKANDFPNIMSSWELTMQYVISIFSAEQYHLFVEPNLKFIMEKSPYLLTTVLVYHKNVKLKRLQRLLVESHVNPLTAYMHFVVARHKPLAFISCNQPLSLSPLHFVLLTHDYHVSVFNLRLHDVDYHNFLYMIFKENKKSNAFKCPDVNGFNIFHYSLIGGNFQSARILMRENITITNKYVSLKDVFLMTMQARLKSDQRNYIKCNEQPSEQSQEKCSDKFLLELFNLKKRSFNYNFFCDNKTMELSLVHLFAINGMSLTIAAVAEMFGKEILTCQNSDRFTPLYFAKLFQQEDIVSLVGDHYGLTLPIVQAEEWLIWSMLTMFTQTNISERLFPFSNSLVCPHYSTRHLLKDSVLVHNFFKDLSLMGVPNYSHICDKVLGKLLSSDIPDIVSFINLFELLYLNNESISCNSRVVALMQQHKMFQTTIIDFISFQHINGCHVTKKLLKPFLAKCYQVNNLFTKMKTRIFNDCENTSSFILEGVITYQLVVSARQLCFKLQRLYKSVAISFFLQYGKTFKIRLPESYEFMQFRRTALKFNVHEKFSGLSKLQPLVAMNYTSLHRHRYLNIVKSTIAYKYLKPHIVVDIFSVRKLLDQSKNEVDVIKNFLLKEPFKDLG